MRLLTGFSTEANALKRSNEIFLVNTPDYDPDSVTQYMFAAKQNLDTGEWALRVPEDMVIWLPENEQNALVEDDWRVEEIPI